MRCIYLFGCLIVGGLLAVSTFAQLSVVLNDPLKEEKSAAVSPADERLIKTIVLPKVQNYWAQAIKDEECGFEFQPTGAIKGAFSKPASNQTLVFFEVCQTGNGIGNNGLTLIENGKVLASYVSVGGWAMMIKKLPDINQNGLNEFTLTYSGGMHQGQGGTGVDIWEFNSTGLKGIGWFQADSFGEPKGDYSYKVTAKAGKIPVFYREKYLSTGENKWRKSGTAVPHKLGTVVCDFTPLK